ncbi:MAG: GNAT family N-acetyltransferase, partial [Patescibacteria group bacterium]
MEKQVNFTIHDADKRHLADVNRLIVGTRIGSAMKKLEGRFWFARVGGHIVGCMGVEVIGVKTAILTHLAVEEGYRRQGVGMSLFRHAMAVVRAE